MITVSHLKKSFGGDVILSDVNLTLAPGQRIGLVGRNGCGKTTLLKILSNQLEPDSGTVVLGPGSRVGYLGQEGQLTPDRTLYEEMRALFKHVFMLEAALRSLETAMGEAHGGALAETMNEYARLQAEYDVAEGHLIDPKIRTVLAGMGFRQEDFDRRCREFSGGWQMRGAMAKLLLSEPTLLLLDEPTNHLDVSATEWLEEYLTSYPGAVLLVSHDRYFLDRVLNHIVELEDGMLADYRGNYSFYLEEKARRIEAQEAAYENQQKKLEHDRAFIERFRYKATLASRVKSREKMLEKMERVEAPKSEARGMYVSFTPASTSGRDTLVAKGIYKSYGAIDVLRDVGLKAERSDRIALVGANGAGKSTLLRILALVEPPDRGSVNPGFRLQPVYFAQHQAEALNRHLTPLQELEAAAPPGTDQTRLRTILGCLLFTGDEVHKRIEVLSGGERSRVALARCVAQPSNVLFLDEPTNHLDIVARENLLAALQQYEGTIIFISHDRHFMDELANKVVEIADGRATPYLGNYSDYRRKKPAQAPPAAAPVPRPTPGRSVAIASAPAANGPNGKAPPPKQRNVNKWKIEALENKIFATEEEIGKLTEQMADPKLGARAGEVRARYDKLRAEVEVLTREWEELAGGL